MKHMALTMDETNASTVDDKNWPTMLWKVNVKGCFQDALLQC